MTTYNELTTWVKDTRLQAEYLQERLPMPKGEAEKYTGIMQNIYNCLDCFVDILEFDEYDDMIHEYKTKRAEQLKEQATIDDLIDKVTSYEVELIDYADRLLSDEPIATDSETAFRTLELLGGEAVALFKSVDVDKEHQGLEHYRKP